MYIAESDKWSLFMACNKILFSGGGGGGGGGAIKLVNFRVGASY